ncbi:hypothetical protein NA57DRAFT_54706 [Rhizodiscina lignyota]|uniref:Uncharacterized protein n=1 Tax=Rhizodiscina lignyota TaxID=1504668 RepID=A0A9P4IJY2_9PEZI|nr:hypothetical protein NA57DRAFT_54706 [Rhizodiscina lignyota]
MGREAGQRFAHIQSRDAASRPLTSISALPSLYELKLPGFASSEHASLPPSAHPLDEPSPSPPTNNFPCAVPQAARLPIRQRESLTATYNLQDCHNLTRPFSYHNAADSFTCTPPRSAKSSVSGESSRDLSHRNFSMTYGLDTSEVGRDSASEEYHDGDNPLAESSRTIAFANRAMKKRSSNPENIDTHSSGKKSKQESELKVVKKLKERVARQDQRHSAQRLEAQLVRRGQTNMTELHSNNQCSSGLKYKKLETYQKIADLVDDQAYEITSLKKELREVDDLLDERNQEITTLKNSQQREAAVEEKHEVTEIKALLGNQEELIRTLEKSNGTLKRKYNNAMQDQQTLTSEKEGLERVAEHWREKYLHLEERVRIAKESDDEYSSTPPETP